MTIASGISTGIAMVLFGIAGLLFIVGVVVLATGLSQHPARRALVVTGSAMAASAAALAVTTGALVLIGGLPGASG